MRSNGSNNAWLQAVKPLDQGSIVFTDENQTPGLAQHNLPQYLIIGNLATWFRSHNTRAIGSVADSNANTR